MNKKILLISCLIFMMFVSVGFVSAEDFSDINSTSLSIDSDYDSQDFTDDEKLATFDQEVLGDAVNSDDIPTVDSGTVSGGVDVVAKHPWGPSDKENGNHGGITYKIPSKATDIKLAYVYVNIYSGSAQPTYGSIADISIKTEKEYINHTENLWISSGTTDGTLYIVNDHITKCYSDYMIFYDITDNLQGLNGTSVSVDVSSLPMEGKSFDGRIKLVSLIVAYDDGDSDIIDYWINEGQAWTDDTTSTTFGTDDVEIDYNSKVTLTNIALSSNDAMYSINGEFLFEEVGDEYIDGDYYQYHKWDITDYFGGETVIDFIASEAGWGSFKEVISVLVVDHNFSDDEDNSNRTSVSLKTEFSTGVNPVICVYAGTNNTVTANLITNNKGFYTVELLADGVVVDRTDVNLIKNVAEVVYLTDPTIRTVDENTIDGADNVKVNYTVRVLLDGEFVNASSEFIPVVYNGYLGKDLAYPNDVYEVFNQTITGDIVMDVKDDGSYLERTDLMRTDVWNVNLPKDSNFVKAYVYVPYNYFIPNYSNKVPEDINMFDVTFNDAVTIPVGFYRDQSNLGNYAKYGYGLLVYDVTELIRNGENTFVLNKKDTYPAVHPSTLIYMFNTTGSNEIKQVYIANGADLLESIYNLANRPVKSDLTIDLNSKSVKDAKLYVFAAGAQRGEGNVIFNGEKQTNVWKGTIDSTDVFKLDITKSIKDSNNISFVSTGSTILALQQIIVVTKEIKTSVHDIVTGAGDIVFAGVKNNVEITINNTGSGKFTVRVLADGVEVNSTEIVLKENSISLSLIDSTIRPVTEGTAYGANNGQVNYTVEILSNDKVVDMYSKLFSVLYNGYLGKDLEYPGEGYEMFFKGTITGDIVIDTKDSYLSVSTPKRTDVWNINLPKDSNFVKALVYVPYYFYDHTYSEITEGLDMFSTVFNGVKIYPVAMYRDQSNYGVYAENGYGLLVYDVSNLISQGNNTFTLSKDKTSTTVCPSSLVYLFNTTGSTVKKNVYISNGADLLSSMEINSLDQAKSTNSFAGVDLNNVADARLYVFAAGAQKGEGNIIFNENEFADVWKGSVYSTECYSLDAKDGLKNNNTVSFVSTKDVILALHQILVTSVNKVSTGISSKNVNMIYLSGTQLVATLKDANEKLLSNKDVVIKINGRSYVRTTDSNGKVKLTISLPPKTYYSATLTFAGDDDYLKSSSSVKVVVKKATPKLTASKKTFKVKTKTKKYTVVFKNHKGKVFKKVKLTLKVNGKTYKATTNSKGKATFKITKLTKKGKFTATVKFAGTKYYNAVSKKVKITVKK